MKPAYTRNENGYLDPVFIDEDTGLFYFYEETWADYQGPFTTEDEARQILQHYCETVLCSS